MPMLRPRHEAFARRRVVALDESQTASYRAVGYRARGHSAYVNASRLLRNAEVARRIEELQAQAAARHERKIDTIGRQLDEAHAMAVRLGQASAAVSASMALAKLYGLIVTKHERQKASGLEACKSTADVVDAMLEQAGSAEAAI